MRSIVAQKDWSQTPLGPQSEWPQSLKTTVNTVLDCTFPKIILWGKDLIQIYNDGYRDVMGDKHPAGLGQPTKECWPETWEFNEPIYKRVFDGEVIKIENQFFQINRHGKKEDVWFTLSYSPIRDESDKVSGVLVTNFETTKKLQAETSLKKSEQRFRQLAENIDAILWIHSWPERKRLYLSPAVKKIAGLDPKEILEGTAKAWINTIHPEDQQRLSEAYENQVANGGFHEQYRIIVPDGSIRWLNERSFPIRNEDGEVYRILGIADDITKQKQQEKELQHLNEELEHRVETRTATLRRYQRKLQSLVGELSNARERERLNLARELHDNIGQILAVCKMRLQALYEVDKDDLHNEIVPITALVDDAINYSRRLMVDLEPPPSSEEMNLRASLEWVAQKMRRHHLKVTIKSDDLPKPLDEKSRSALLYAVRELLLNVVKHAKVGKANIIVRKTGQKVQVSVQDEGEGFEIKKDQQSFMSESTFGLFSIKERVHLLGGTFHIVSEPGKGTTAIVKFPLEKKQNQSATDPQKEEPEVSNLTKLPVIEVVVVDDHQMIRKMITKIINKEPDLKVTAAAASGEEGIEAVAEDLPDVVIMDVNLPGINGIEATKKIKRAHPEVAIIGLSFHNEKELVNEMYEAGVSGFVSKDEALDVICKIIRDVGR